MMKTAWLIVLAGCGVAPTTFPRDIQESSGDRLKIEWWELADGHLQVRGVYDTQLAGDCNFERQSDGTYACGALRLPLDVQPASSRVVATSVCMDRFVLPIGLYDTERGVECTPKSTVTGELRCTPIAADPTLDDPIVTIESAASDGERLEAQYVTTEDGLRQHVPSFFDTALGTGCSVRAPSSDATAFCMPAGEVHAPMEQYVLAVATIDP